MYHGLNELCFYWLSAKPSSYLANICRITVARVVCVIRGMHGVQADLIFSVQRLRSGYSKDVNGQLTIERVRDSSGDRQRMLHYKIGDHSVEFFAPGTSKAVL